VGKFLGRPISLNHDGLSSLWNLHGDWEIFPMSSYGYFIFRFTNPEDLEHVLLDGPWILDNAVLALGHLTPPFPTITGDTSAGDNIDETYLLFGLVGT